MMGMYREELRKKFREAGDMIRKQAQEQSDHKQTMDMVNNPPHYNKAGIETIEAIKAMTDTGFEYYLQGNIMKYLWRYRYKNGVEDLKKAQWYLNELIDVIEDDTEEYPIPSDDKIDEEMKDYISDLIHEIDGVTLKHIKILQERKQNE
jgi:hypothetical protein